MALDFSTNPGGLFPRLGRIFHVAYLADVYEASLPAAFTAIQSQYAALPKVTAPLLITSDALTRVASGVMAFTIGGEGQTNTAWDTIVQMVYADQPTQSWTRSSAMAEVIRQMKAQSVTVQACTVSSSAVVLSGNTGDGVVVLTTKRGDGLVQENTIAEGLRLTCTLDSYTGNQTVGAEQFSLVGTPSTGGVWDYDYPAGSGIGTQFNAITPTVDATPGGNLLTNSDFEDWSSDATPELSNWTLSGGTWGTDLARSTTVYAGTYSVKYVAGTAATPILYQPFDDSTGTSAALSAQSSYPFNCWLKADGAVTAGTMIVELTDSSGTILNDAQGNPSSLSIDLTALTTSWVAHNTTFRTPVNPPDVIRIRYRISAAITGANVYLNHSALAAVTAMYTGGPGVAVFSGATPWVGGDGWTVTNANDYGGASYCATFQIDFDRVFDMKSLGMLLPSSGTPTIADTLITS